MNPKGKIVTLRPIEKKDLQDIQKWSNDPEIQNLLGGWHFPTSMVVMEKWFERINSDELNQRFAIDHKENGLVGTANLVEINWKDKNAFHGMLIGNKNMRGKGIGIDVVFSIMRYAFEELGMNRLDSSIIEYNKASLKLYIEKCGWKKEGEIEEWYWRKNKFWNKIIVGITRNNYLNLIEQNGYWND